MRGQWLINLPNENHVGWGTHVSCVGYSRVERVGHPPLLGIDSLLLVPYWRGDPMNRREHSGPEYSGAPYPRRGITRLIRVFSIGIAACVIGGIVLNDWRYLVVSAAGALMV